MTMRAQHAADTTMPTTMGTLMSGGTPPSLWMSQAFLRTAAAMAGVESRNEKRAAVSRFMSRNRPALMVAPLREVPGITANGLRDADHDAIAPADFAHRFVADAAALGDPDDNADHDQHRADHVGLTPGGVGLLIEQVSDDADRNGGDGQQPQQPAILAELRIVAPVEPEALPDDLDPVAKEVNEHRDQRARVQRDVEREPGVLPSEEPRDQHQVRGAANGQEFGEGLHDGENDHLINGHELAS